MDNFFYFNLLTNQQRNSWKRKFPYLFVSNCSIFLSGFSNEYHDGGIFLSCFVH